MPYLMILLKKSKFSWKQRKGSVKVQENFYHEA